MRPLCIYITASYPLDYNNIFFKDIFSSDDALFLQKEDFNLIVLPRTSKHWMQYCKTSVKFDLCLRMTRRKKIRFLFSIRTLLYLFREILLSILHRGSFNFKIYIDAIVSALNTRQELYRIIKENNYEKNL